MLHDSLCNHSYIEIVNHSCVPMCNDGYVETLGERIERLRKERNLSQQQVASAAQVSRVAVTKWESGATKNLKLENLLAMCDLFGVSAEELISGADSALYIRQVRAKYENSPSGLSLSDEEGRIVAAYRRKTRPEQVMVLKLLDLDHRDFAKSA